ncbi:hypothetical protein HDU97_002992 [Phlyctochytrium planicorne]|nr:hypothetical protein HDU97_002992 [Phlyctochytrium planicorne]
MNTKPRYDQRTNSMHNFDQEDIELFLKMAHTLNLVLSRESRTYEINRMLKRSTPQLCYFLRDLFELDDPVRWITLFTTFVDNNLIQTFKEKLGNLEMLTWLFERTIWAVLLLTSKCCFMPQSWARELTERFLGLKVGDLCDSSGERLYINLKSALFRLSDAVTVTQTIKLRFSVLYIILMQHDRNVAGVSADVNYRISDSFKDTWWPNWLRKASAFESLHRMIEVMEDRLILIAKGSTLNKTDRVVQAALKIAPIVAFAPEEAPTLFETLQSIDVNKKEFNFNVNAPEFIPADRLSESDEKEYDAEVLPQITDQEAIARIELWYRRKRRPDRKFDRMFAELCAKSNRWFEDAIRLCKDSENWAFMQKRWRYRATFRAQGVDAILQVNQAITNIQQLIQIIGRNFKLCCSSKL